MEDPLGIQRRIPTEIFTIIKDLHLKEISKVRG